MSRALLTIAAACLVIGALLGMGGTFAPADALRRLAWGVDGILLVVGSALFVSHHQQQGNHLPAVGFLVFLAGETLILYGSLVDLTSSGPAFAAGAGLWSAGLLLVSAWGALPQVIRATGAIAAILLAITATRIMAGNDLTPLTRPLPFFAYPFLAITLFGWAWAHTRSLSRSRA